MIYSMTGFGRAEGELAGRRWQVETRSVNGRFLEVKVRMPKRYSSWEAQVRELSKKRFKRGRVEVFIQENNAGETGPTMRLDIAAAKALYEQLVALKEEIGIDEPVTLAHLMAGRDVFVAAENDVDLDDLWKLVSPLVEEALDGLLDMRKKEGIALDADLRENFRLIEADLEAAGARVEINTASHKTRLEERITRWLDGVQLDEERLMQEVAILVDKGDVSEELVRAKSHVEQCRKFLDSGKPVGRKIEFLIQELHREVNTLSAKSCDAEISKLAVDTKAALERIREQIQNVE